LTALAAIVGVSIVLSFNRANIGLALVWMFCTVPIGRVPDTPLPFDIAIEADPAAMVRPGSRRLRQHAVSVASSQSSQCCVPGLVAINLGLNSRGDAICIVQRSTYPVGLGDG
jgi:hypothetical protein